MEHKMTKIALFGALIGVISLSAQDPSDAAAKKLAEAKAQRDGVKILSASLINGPTVKGAPYSAQAVNEMVQTLADGNRIVNTTNSMLYRDSQGRERREESSGGSAPAVRSIFITDPVDGVSYTLEPNNNVALKHSQRAVTIALDGAADMKHGEQAAKIETRTFIMNSSGGGPETFIFSNQEFNSSKVKPVIEHLGTQMMEGVSAEGTRTTVTIPAGQIGNEQPIVTVTERWYSPELQVTVMTKRSDPRTGTTTYKLTNINRAEPSPALFQVPADYTIKSMGDDLKFRDFRTKPDEQ